MKILALECSACSASVCIVENGKILSSSYINVKMTHSQTLLPMVESALNSAKITLKDINALAVSAGPGSFTGIRIAISAVKGLALKDKLPSIGVSTLESMAQLYKSQDGIICTVMDARCNQVYNALFRVQNGTVARLCDDRAILCDELKNELITNFTNENIIVTGDGSDLFYNFVADCDNVRIAPENLKYQNAVGVAFAAEIKLKDNVVSSPSELLPIYLRLPQAERELKKRKTDNKES